MRRWDPPPMASKRAPARPPVVVRVGPIGPDGTRTPAPASASHASARQLGTGSSARQYGMRQRQRPPGPPAPHVAAPVPATNSADRYQRPPA